MIIVRTITLRLSDELKSRIATLARETGTSPKQSKY